MIIQTLAILVILAAMIFATTISVQLASAASSTQGASTFAPGIKKGSEGDSQSASELAPGILKGRLPGGGCDAPSFAPGHIFRQQQPDNP